MSPLPRKDRLGQEAAPLPGQQHPPLLSRMLPLLGGGVAQPGSRHQAVLDAGPSSLQRLPMAAGRSSPAGRCTDTDTDTDTPRPPFSYRAGAWRAWRSLGGHFCLAASAAALEPSRAVRGAQSVTQTNPLAGCCGDGEPGQQQGGRCGAAWPVWPQKTQAGVQALREGGVCREGRLNKHAPRLLQREAAGAPPPPPPPPPPVRQGRSPARLLAMRLLLLLVTLPLAFAAEESCEGRCDLGFDALKKCQCDDLCIYYQSCCTDYAATCKSKVTRGDVFLQPEDEYPDYYDPDLPNVTTTVRPATTSPAPEATTGYEYVWAEEPARGTEEPARGTEEPARGTEATDSTEETLCSGKPFDAFASLKNGSIYAFRGRHFYELDEKSARPGYPKLIEEVWGIPGPIDAAFTRINCQGKTYLFQGSQYWRFDDGLLDPEYPRNISDGFKGIPHGVDAAFALPAQNYFASERVYFFQGGASRPRPLLRDWKGLPAQLPRLDAAMVGRIYVSRRAPQRRSGKRPSRQHRRRYRNRQRWGRWDPPSWDWLDEASSESSDLDWLWGSDPPCQPLQSVYFFAEDKYYRLNLQTRRVDTVKPRYPRSIAKYWLGCPEEEEDLA
ncbi:vitronectin isoform X2 [Hemicordylus capensis]|uniref:vitronectin isoform X2 n=1 Tax=Hemicordylus capensis TaxID=884348 RepID=UPI002302F424|nr:vitronectin isoform X2 [Hemicordylus capensis]